MKDIYALCLTSLMILLSVTIEARRFTGSHARKHSVPKGADDCRRVTCQSGSTCTTNDLGLPECTCVESCPVRVKPTCGSDDKWYESHCHLHQTACLTDTKISVHHGNECFSRGITCSGINKQTFKSRVIDHYTTQFKHPQHTSMTSDDKVSKNLLLGLIFNHYDLDQNDFISKDEVLVSMTRDVLLSISTHCTMTDVLEEHDANGDGRWSNDEFFEAFGVGGYDLEEGLRTKETMTTAGDRLVLGCDIHGDSVLPDIMWTRNGVALDTLNYVDGIQMFGDGHLYFTPVTTMHAGNYTCSIRGRVLPTQTYTVRVKVAPTVRVCPENQLMATGKAAKFYCKAWGVPQPTISWQRNGLRLRENEVTALNNRTLTINDAKIENSGRFICSAKNDIGTKEVNAVLVEEEAICL